MISSDQHRLDAEAWNHNYHYHPLLLGVMPRPCPAALDIGSGDGLLARKLAARATNVVGIDVSKDMVDTARSKTAQPNVTYVEGDFLAHPFEPESFDFISAVASIHHMDFDRALRKAADLLRPGGVLGVVGLPKISSPVDFGFAAAGVVLTNAYRLRRPTAMPGAPVLDPDMTHRQVRTRAAEILPGARCRRRVLFRYSLIWHKPADR